MVRGRNPPCTRSTEAFDPQLAGRDDTGIEMQRHLLAECARDAQKQRHVAILTDTVRTGPVLLRRKRSIRRAAPSPALQPSSNS
jgi:hypothetical protein